jgi:isoleucyl-tRNA synthetase
MNQECFKNVICLGWFWMKKGHKMSKHIGNCGFSMGCDQDNGLMRCAGICLLPARPVRNADSHPIWSMKCCAVLRCSFGTPIHFFVMYANLDGWTPNKEQKIELVI